MRNFLRSWTAILILALAGFPRSGATQEVPEDIGLITASQKILYKVAVPSFHPMEGSRTLKAGTFNSIVYNDLVMSGFFSPIEDQRFVEEAAARDRRQGQIDYAEWKAVGAQFLAVCEYSLDSSNNLLAVCRLFSVSDGAQVMGRQYTKFTADRYRELAHRISDDIVHALTHVQGIASTKIVYVSRRGRSNEEIYMCDADGYNHRPLTRDRSLVLAPAWGANATEIYYTSYKDNNPDLCGVYVDGTQSWFISRWPGGNISPSFNHERKRVALTLSKDGNSEIYTMSRNGEDLKRLTQDKGIDSTPTWSPDGGRIAFTSNRATGMPQIYVMDADGTNQRRITFTGRYNDAANWSPNGERIAFVSRADNGNFNVFTMDTDGRDWKQLTRNAGNNEDPSWAPDGEHIVFSSNRTGTYHLYVMNSDGSNVHKITSEGENLSPDWSPFFYESQ